MTDADHYYGVSATYLHQPNPMDPAAPSGKHQLTMSCWAGTWRGATHLGILWIDRCKQERQREREKGCKYPTSHVTPQSTKKERRHAWGYKWPTKQRTKWGKTTRTGPHTFTMYCLNHLSSRAPPNELPSPPKTLPTTLTDCELKGTNTCQQPTRAANRRASSVCEQLQTPDPRKLSWLLISQLSNCTTKVQTRMIRTKTDETNRKTKGTKNKVQSNPKNATTTSGK